MVKKFGLHLDRVHNSKDGKLLGAAIQDELYCVRCPKVLDVRSVPPAKTDSDFLYFDPKRVFPGTSTSVSHSVAPFPDDARPETVNDDDEGAEDDEIEWASTADTTD